MRPMAILPHRRPALAAPAAPCRRAGGRAALAASLVASLAASACGGPAPGASAPTGAVTDGTGEPVVPPAPTSRYVSAVAAFGQYAASSPLPPLPAPALTPAPDAADEPRAVLATLHADVGIPLLEERSPPPADPPALVSEESFLEGPPDPVVSAPPGHDPALNRPPLFVGLEDVTLYAGQRLELRLAPIDPDGGIAGQHLERLPRGALYLDNLDTTRTLVWEPLEPDVGIHELRVVTHDAQEPRLNVTYTVRVRVLMPSDPDSIENRPPDIDPIDPQSVRSGDTVVVEIAATDPNGTVPSLELIDPPAGATLLAHPDDPRLRVLRVVPRSAGTLEIGVLARDARDPALTHAETITLEVRSPDDYAIDGLPLRRLAAARDFLIGYAAASGYHRRADGALYADTAAREYNLVTAENAMKWDALNPAPGVYRWAEADNIVAQARAAEQLVHGHTLVWYTQLPSWVKAAEPALLEGHLREHIDRVLRRYADAVPVWDVVNEALDEDGGFRESIWSEAMGPAYIDIAFRQARASAPSATLLYNDYGIGRAGPKADGLFALLETMLAAGTPIDGVGFQMHVDAGFDRFDELAANLRRVGDLGLDVWITELDVSMLGEQTEAAQAEVYAQVLSVCLAEPRCRALQSWGFTDRHSWLEPYTPLPLDRDYRAKPAYLALQRRLGEN